MCRNSVLVFVQDPVCAREAWNNVWSTHVFGAVHRLKKRAKRRRIFLLLLVFLVQEKSRGELAADGRTASWREYWMY